MSKMKWFQFYSNNRNTGMPQGPVLYLVLKYKFGNEVRNDK